MAGTIIADYIRTDANKLSLNVGNTTFATINATGFYSNTGVQIIDQNGVVTLFDGQVTTSKIANTSITTSKIANNSIVVGKIDSTAIVGTVSQSGGLVTGSVIEKGTNANGSYIKYADGTQICWKYVTGGWSGSYNTNNNTCPVTFVADPACTWNTIPTTNHHVAACVWVSSNTWQFRHPDTSTQSYWLTAVGRWY
jgi:hypothetical protein